MKFALKVILTVAIVTSCVVLYVHGEVAIFQVSYSLDAHARLLKERSEEYRRIKFEVEQLKAPRLLEEKMNQMNLELTLPRQVKVVRIPELPSVADAAMRNVNPQSFTQSPLDFLGRWVKVAVAQAKMES
ncbi:MAG TPA: hypothetical protein VL688_05500 [Verrucomicrobiae bacterium]|jgi:hypothetical protein|nr:hypothetical protein [Verrucomicrobiae bacterium]